ncbi:hypothetical protein CEXT_673001 [Caerostris extrusa]|uniref:Uncharacterized protein n=1 Tax=Caerostris extrusa TaxID=172846 RepID=A0AAV4X2Q5_CAEEX|nr:hypothetical protein CEXT_673001 [Caerostris extrusa]
MDYTSCWPEKGDENFPECGHFVFWFICGLQRKMVLKGERKLPLHSIPEQASMALDWLNYVHKNLGDSLENALRKSTPNFARGVDFSQTATR